jgi:hypothetical protein
MKIENQVCTLDQADRLKELGVVQESLFYHTHSDWGVMPKNSIDFSGDPSSAFTVAELGVMLPHPDNLSEIGGFLHLSTFDPGADNKPWYCIWEYDTDKYGMKRKLIDGNTEAESRAGMLIHLLETATITPAEVNERLKANA